MVCALLLLACGLLSRRLGVAFDDLPDGTDAPRIAEVFAFAPLI